MKPLIFICGLCIGGGIGAFGAYRYLKKKMDKELEEKLNEETTKLFDLYEEKLMESNDDLDDEPTDQELAAKLNADKPDLSSYKSLADHYNYSDSEEQQPYVVDEEEYMEDSGQNVVLLTYYKKDDMYIEDVSEQPFNTDKFGDLTFNDIFDDPTEGDIAYVRDAANRIDYEITYTNESLE